MKPRVKASRSKVAHTQPPAGAKKQWAPKKEILWQPKEQIKVQFMNDVPQRWAFCRGKEEILEIANEWHNCGDVVPKFIMWEHGTNESSDITVQFNGMLTLLLVTMDVIVVFVLRLCLQQHWLLSYCAIYIATVVHTDILHLLPVTLYIHDVLLTV